ncbi:hypothetical protein D6779_04600, partial [Candidatus Parcubacteria bacterium]
TIRMTLGMSDLRVENRRKAISGWARAAPKNDGRLESYKRGRFRMGTIWARNGHGRLGTGFSGKKKALENSMFSRA